MTVTASNIPRLFSRVADLTDAPKLGGGKLLWVDAARGDDATAQRGRRELPFKTCGLAKTLAQAGDTIIVLPGVYNENDLAKNGVNWHFENGASIAFAIVLASAITVRGIFDDYAGAASFTVTGFGAFSMDISETDVGVGGNQDVQVVRQANASSVITFQGRSVSISISLDSGSGGEIKQSNGGGIYTLLDTGVLTLTGGTATINATNGNLGQSGGTCYAHYARNGSITVSGGTCHASAPTSVSIAVSGGTAFVHVGDTAALNHSGGDLDFTAAYVGAFTRGGSSGNGSYTVGRFGSIVISQSGTAESVLNGGYIRSTSLPAVILKGGKIIWRRGEVRETAPTGIHGSDLAIGFGGVGVTTDLTLEDMVVRCNDSTHSCLRMYDEDPGGSTFRVIGGAYQAGSAGYWFDPEHATTIITRNVITTNRPAGPFATQGGNGAILQDATVNL
jgi:hypothetical protein